MDMELTGPLTGTKEKKWIDLLARCGLEPDPGVERTALLWEGDALVAAGSRQGAVLKCIAVSPDHQGEGLTATVLTQLRQDAFAAGLRHLFLYTKPENGAMFAPLFFYPVAKTDRVLLMESERDGVSRFLAGLEAPRKTGEIGAVVMNCNPFTRGHRYLVETAAGQCDHLYLFVLSEEQGLFPAADRLALVKAGTADLPNVTVHPTGPYLISAATFPSYFLKDSRLVSDAHCLLDIAVFTRHFVPAFGVTRRFVGTEPLCPVTARYNELLGRRLPEAGVAVTELPRLERGGAPVSASAVRALLGKNQPEALRALVPDATFVYLQARELI